MLNCCSCNHRIFHHLLELFEPVFNTYTLDDSSRKICAVVATSTGGGKGRKRERLMQLDVLAHSCSGIGLTDLLQGLWP